MTQYVTNSAQQTEQLGQKLAEKLTPGSVVALFGPMGMGKTALTRGIALGLGCGDVVSSPTFALVHEYPGRLTVYHFDMYRVTGMDDLYSTGFFDYLDTDAVLVIEWSENILDAIPENAIRLYIEKGESDDERVLRVYEPAEAAAK